MAASEPTKEEIVTRIAPTPSGLLHAGNAFSFVLTWLLVRKMGGKLLLRIDDSDTTRSRPEYVEDIFYTLDWLGLDYDIGPQGPDDFERNFSQRHRMDLYHLVLEELKEKTARMFACTCSRRQIQQQSYSGLYTGNCRNKEIAFTNKRAAWRIQVPEQEALTYLELTDKSAKKLMLGREMGDFVVRRKDGLPAYQVASLADDMHFGVNLLVRGQDLCLSTGAQLYLAQQLAQAGTSWKRQAGRFMKAGFFHHPLLKDSTGEKLSKSKGASSVAVLREAGRKPFFVYKMVADFIGLPFNEGQNLMDLLQGFDIAALQQKHSS